MTESNTSKPQSRWTLRQFAGRWFEPRATDRDEAFRERILRAAVAIIILLDLLSFASTIFIFRDSWSIISFPTLHLAALVLCSTAALMLLRGNLLIAGWLLVFTVLIGASGVVMLSRQHGTISGLNEAVALFFFIPLVASLVLTQNSIFYVTLLSMVAYALSRSILPIGKFAQADAAALAAIDVELLTTIDGRCYAQAASGRI